MILAEKHFAQKRHYAHTGGSTVSYAKLLTKKYRAAMKRREAKNGHAVAAK